MSSTGSGASLLQRALVRLVDASRRHAWTVVLAGILLAVGSGLYASRHLGVNTDTDQMFSASLPWRQRAMALDRAFPQFQGLLVAVIDANVPEEAEETARDLTRALAADHTDFSMVSQPGSSPYLSKEGLLFLSTPELTDLMNRTIDAQPFLGTLSADPTSRGLFSALGLLGQGVTHGDANLAPYADELRAFHTAMEAAVAGHPQPLSWQQLLSSGLGDLAGKYQFVLAKPRLDYHSLQPGGAATAAIRAAAARLAFVQSGAAHVRITGPVALADTQFATVAEGTVTGLIGSVALIALWLALAVGSWRLIVPILATLGLGLMLTLLFAATAIGTLNLVSVGFGVLFVGIAVDFGLQFAVRFREAEVRYRRRGGRASADRPSRGKRHPRCSTGHGGGLSCVRTNGFQWRGRAWTDCRHRHVDCVLLHNDFPARGDHDLPCARRGSRSRFLLGPQGRCSAHTLARIGPGRVRSIGCAGARACSAPLVRFRPTGHAESKHRGDAHLARSDEPAAEQSLQHRYPCPKRGGGAPAGDEAAATADGLKGTYDRKLRARRASCEARADCGRGRYPDTEPVAATDTRPATPAEIRTAAQSALAQINPALHLLPQGDPLNAIAGDLAAIAHAPDSTVRAVDGALTRIPAARARPPAHRSWRRAGRCLIGALGYRTGLAPAGWAGAGRGAAGRVGAQQPGAAPVRRRGDAAWRPMPAARR